LDHVTVEALPTEVPDFFELDVTPLVEINQALHVSDLELPEDVVMLTDVEQVVAKVAPPAVEPEPEVVEEEEAVEGEAVEEGAEEGAAEPAAAEGEQSE
ncbi:MAG TPA: 50S ribosomal protein L25, partial [Dehalococcoidia bacterium]|nr:50S ribosomal protein L25 [Dehalococcoidia bacterium]